jgi:hypothetical protein
MSKEKKIDKEDDIKEISKPFGFKHEIKVTADSSGLKGLPKEWEDILYKDLTEEEINGNIENLKINM